MYKFVKHSLQLVVISGCEGKISSKQQVGHFKTGNARDRALHPSARLSTSFR